MSEADELSQGLEDAKEWMKRHAMKFYREAEAPTPADFEWLFHALVEVDQGEMEALFDRFHLETEE